MEPQQNKEVSKIEPESWTSRTSHSDQKEGGRKITKERRGWVKSGNMYKGLMGKDKGWGEGLNVGDWG